MHPHPSAEEALASVDQAVAAAQDRAERAHDYRRRLDRLRVTGRSRDGVARVTLSHTGALSDLHLERTAEHLGAERVRAVVLEANRAAQGHLVAAVTEVTAEAFGRDSATAREIARQYADLFPPPAEPGATVATDRPGVLR